MIRIGYPKLSLASLKCRILIAIKFGGVAALHAAVRCERDEDCIYLIKANEYNVIDLINHESVHHVIDNSKIIETALSPINAHQLWDGIEYAWKPKNKLLIMPLCWYVHNGKSRRPHNLRYNYGAYWAGICEFCWKLMTKNRKFKSVEKWVEYCSRQSSNDNGLSWGEVERRLKNCIEREYGKIEKCKCPTVKSIYKDGKYWLCCSCNDVVPEPALELQQYDAIKFVE